MTGLARHNFSRSVSNRNQSRRCGGLPELCVLLLHEIPARIEQKPLFNLFLHYLYDCFARVF